MVDVSLTTHVSVAPVSAREIYARWTAKHKSSPLTPVTLHVPKTGVSQSDEGALAWIDTAFAQSLATERFISAIRAGHLPSTLDATSEHAFSMRFFYTSAARLAERDISIVEALGLTEELAELALSSTILECPRCKGICERYPSAQQALAALQGKFSGSTAVFAEGPSETLPAWARSQGLSTEPQELREQNQLTSRTRIQIDTLEIPRDTSSRLSPLTHSLWRLRRPALVAMQGNHIVTFYKHGHCTSCGHLFDEERMADITAALRATATHQNTTKLIGSHVLPHGKSMRATLQQPLRSLGALMGTLKSRALALALQTNVRETVLGATTRQLSASALSMLAVCRSLGDAIDANGVCLIGNREFLLSSESFEPSSRIVSEASATIGIVVISSKGARKSESVVALRSNDSGQPIGCVRIQPPGSDAITYSLRQGHDVAITETTFREIEAALQARPIANSCVSFAPASHCETFSLPVFRSEPRSRSLLLHKLGIADSLATLFASSVDARSVGLRPKDFILSTHKRTHRTVCERCDGAGLVLQYIDDLPRPLARECGICQGARFKGKIGAITWKGLSLSTLFNTPLSETLSLIRALPRASDLISMLEALELVHLPLGMPIALMSESERYAITWIQALRSASAAKPAIVLLEVPAASLTPGRWRGLRDLLENSPRAKHLAVATVR